MKTTKDKMTALSAVLLLLLLLGTLLAGNLKQNQTAFDLGAAYTAEEAAAAEKAYQADAADRNLIDLLKALCYQYKRAGDDTVTPKIRQYGQILLDRAKAGEIDLQKAEDENVMLQLLSVIRETGAR